MVSESYFTNSDRILQLRDTARKLDMLIKFFSNNAEYADFTSICKDAKNRAENLLSTGFTQAELSELGRLLEDPWALPAHIDSPEYYQEAWYKELRTHLDPALNALSKLTLLGEIF